MMTGKVDTAMIALMAPMDDVRTSHAVAWFLGGMVLGLAATVSFVELGALVGLGLGLGR